MTKILKIVSLLTCMALTIGCVGFFDVNSHAEEGYSKPIEFSVSEIASDGTLKLTVTIPANSDVSYAHFVINYDQEMFTFVKNEFKLGGAPLFATLEDAYSILWYGDAINTRCVADVLTLKLNSNVCGETKLYLSGQLCDDGDNIIEYEITSTPNYKCIGLKDIVLDDNGYCYNNETPIAIGIFNDGSRSKLNSCKFTGLGTTSGSTTIGVSCGSVTKTNLSANVVNKGDNNGDGVVDANDYAQMKSGVFNGVDLTDVENRYKYDICPDGVVDAVDYYYLNRIMYGLSV